ncbi:DUF2156 domain-containing protein [Methanoplanus sp. FWC-SCC4]|uniref:DUF2156 domain-containing protein n=1 Tax=Methanochimaera problematica TaxID=2609417 RepID=A0AA97FBA2_9EURY|nr:phosphatidylglycerol lysyltransferase domain-containing protein [Methanoplanus sp. FWC-SCC4]WOF15732.1 DUF2156 domain-containing protein [Methanoplanus sp. FWC-SCC4]
MLDINDFKLVEISDYDFFKNFYTKYPRQHSDNSFTNMICWNDYATYKYLHINDAVIISSTIEGEISFRGPFGDYDDELLKDTLRLSKKYGSHLAYQIFDEYTKKRIEKIIPDIKINPDRDYYDYVYKTEILKDLPGKHFLSIRKHLNKFKRECDFSVEQISQDNLLEVNEFLIAWCKWKECKKNPILNYEKNATVYAVKHFKELKLSGIALRVKGNISAISIFEELNPTTVVIHYEKGLPDCEGNYKAVNNETAKFLYGKYEYINRESDLGVGGLRIAKMRYNPDHFAKVYFIRAEDIPDDL